MSAIVNHGRPWASCLAWGAVSLLAACAGTAPAPATQGAPRPDNAELRALCDADQADRQNLEAINWHEVADRDSAREKRVHEMLEQGTVVTGADYFNAALICQHSGEVEGIELAHELAMIGAALGDKKSRWLAAASYDRLLNRLGRPQRFGTQYGQKGNEPMSLGEISPGVTDAMRTALNVPTLAQAKAREEEIRKMYEKPKADQHQAETKPDKPR